MEKSLIIVLQQGGKEEGVDYRIQTLPAMEQIDALRDGTIDALVTWARVPEAGYLSLDKTTSIKVLPI